MLYLCRKLAILCNISKTVCIGLNAEDAEQHGKTVLVVTLARNRIAQVDRHSCPLFAFPCLLISDIYVFDLV